MESESGVREVLLVGGPPWGLRLGAVTAAELPAAEEGEEGRVVGAIKIARVSSLFSAVLWSVRLAAGAACRICQKKASFHD